MRLLLTYFSNHPKRIFLIDGVGAMLTTLLLLGILLQFPQIFQIPYRIIYILSALALVFVIHSLSCYFLVHKNWKIFLKLVIIGNLMYCFLTLGLMVGLFDQLSILAVTYFTIEMLVVLTVVYIELRVLRL